MINFVVFVKLTITCDRPGCQSFAVYHGQSEQGCIEIARAYGWHVGGDNVCPQCQERRQTEADAWKKAHGWPDDPTR